MISYFLYCMSSVLSLNCLSCHSSHSYFSEAKSTWSSKLFIEQNGGCRGLSVHVMYVSGLLPKSSSGMGLSTKVPLWLEHIKRAPGASLLVRFTQKESRYNSTVCTNAGYVGVNWANCFKTMLLVPFEILMWMYPELSWCCSLVFGIDEAKVNFCSLCCFMVHWTLRMEISFLPPLRPWLFIGRSGALVCSLLFLTSELSRWCIKQTNKGSKP